MPRQKSKPPPSPVVEAEKVALVAMAATGLAMGVTRYLILPQLQRLQAPALHLTHQVLRTPRHLIRLGLHHSRPGRVLGG